MEFRKVTFHQFSLEGLTQLPCLSFAECMFDDNDSSNPCYNAQGTVLSERTFFSRCTFWGQVSFRKASLSSSLDFRNCEFYAKPQRTSLSLRDTFCNGSINLSGSTFGGHVDASRLRLLGSFRTASRQQASPDNHKQSTFSQHLDLNSARIDGNLSLRSVIVRGTLDLHEAVIGGALILKPYGKHEPNRSNRSVCRYVFGRFLKVGGEIDLRNTIIEDVADFESVQAGSFIAGALSFSTSQAAVPEPYMTVFKSRLNLSHSRLRGDLILSGSLMGSGLLATRAEIDGHLKLQSRRGKRTKICLGPDTGNDSDPKWAVRLESASVKGYASFASADIEGPVWASNLFVGGDLFMDAYGDQDTCTFSTPWQPQQPLLVHSPIFYGQKTENGFQHICSHSFYASFADATMLGAIYFRPQCPSATKGTFDFTGAKCSSFNAGSRGQPSSHNNLFDLTLAECRIEGPIDVSGLKLRGLNVSHARCEGDLVLSHDETRVALDTKHPEGDRLYQKEIEFVHGPHLTLAGDLVGYGVHFRHGCNLEHADISGDLILHRSLLGSMKHQDGYWLSLALSHLTVRGHVSGRGLRTDTGIDGSFMKIGGDVDFSYNRRFGLKTRIGTSENLKTEGPRTFCLWIRGSEIKGMIRLHAVHLVGGVSLRESTVRGSLYLSSSSVRYPSDDEVEVIEAGYSDSREPNPRVVSRFRGNIEEVVTRIGESKNTHSVYSIDARGSNIGGGLYWENLHHSSGAKCESALNFSGATLSSVIIQGVSFGLKPDEPASDTNVLLDLSVSRISLDISLTDVKGPVSCDGAKIGGSLRVRSHDKASVQAAGAGTWPLKMSARGVEIAGELLLLSDWIEHMSNMAIDSAREGHKHDIGLNVSGGQISRIEFVTGRRPRELEKHSIWHVLLPFYWFDKRPTKRFDRKRFAGGRVLTISRATVKELEVAADSEQRSWAKSQKSVLETVFCRSLDKLLSNGRGFTRLASWVKQSFKASNRYIVESFGDPRVQTAASGLLQCFISFAVLVLLARFPGYVSPDRSDYLSLNLLPGFILFFLVILSLVLFFKSLRTAQDLTLQKVDKLALYTRSTSETEKIEVDTANHLTRAVAYLLHKTQFSGSFFLRVADFCSRKGYRLLADEVYLYTRRREEKEFSAIVGFMPLIGHYLLKYGVRGRFWSLGLVCAVLVGWQLVVSSTDLKDLYYESFSSSSEAQRHVQVDALYPYVTAPPDPPVGQKDSAAGDQWILDSALVFGQEVFGSGLGPNSLWGGKSSEIRAEASRLPVAELGSATLSFGLLVTVIRLWWFAFLTISVSRLVGLIRRHSIDGSSKN